MTTTATTVECRRRRFLLRLLLLLHCKPKKCLGQKKMPEKHLLLDQAQANTHTHTHMNTHKTLLFQCVSVLPEDAAGQANCSHLLHFSSALSLPFSLSISLSQSLLFKLSPSNAPPFKLYATCCCCCSFQHIYIWHCILYGAASRTL